jgi:hypothetical protein
MKGRGKCASPCFRNYPQHPKHALYAHYCIDVSYCLQRATRTLERIVIEHKSEPVKKIMIIIIISAVLVFINTLSDLPLKKSVSPNCWRPLYLAGLGLHNLCYRLKCVKMIVNAE